MGSSIKTSVMVLICCGLVQAAASQSLSPEPPARVERSSFGVQVGLIALFVNHELRLADQVALRTELGMHGTISPRPNGHDVKWTLGAIVEPRWYYNLATRQERGKDIAGNSGNFVALRVHYARAGVFASGGNSSDIIAIAPMWGIRRNLGHHFHYEVGAGVGWRTTIRKEDTDAARFFALITSNSLKNLALYLHLRIGYRF